MNFADDKPKTNIFDVLTNYNLMNYCVAPYLDLRTVMTVALATGPTLCENWRQVFVNKFNHHHGLKLKTFETVVLLCVLKSPENLATAGGNLLFASGNAKIAEWVAQVIGHNKFATDKSGTPHRWDATSKLWKNAFEDGSIYSTFCDALEAAIAQATNPQHIKKLTRLWSSITKDNFGRQFPVYFARQCRQLHQLSECTHLIPVKGGMVLDLKSKIFRKRDKLDCCTFELNIDLTTIHRVLDTEQIPVESEFYQFLKKVTCASMELLDYLQRVFGCLVAGDVSAKKMGFLWHGQSNSAKSTLVIEIVIRCFQKYFQEASERVFKQGAAVTHDSELFDAQNAPTLYCDEMPDNYKLTRATINRLVGASSVRVRNANGREMTSIQLKKYVHLLVNHLPRKMDADTLEKIVIIPMLAKFVVDDIDPVQHRYAVQLNFAQNFLSRPENVQHVYQFVLIGALQYWNDPTSVRKFPTIISENRSLLVSARPKQHQHYDAVRQFALDYLERCDDGFITTNALTECFEKSNANVSLDSSEFGKALTSVYGLDAQKTSRVYCKEKGVKQCRGFQVRYKRDRDSPSKGDDSNDSQKRQKPQEVQNKIE